MRQRQVRVHVHQICQLRANLHGLRPKHGAGHVILRDRVRRPAALHDAAFMPRDAVHGRPEQVRMVQSDARKAARERPFKDVGRVLSPAGVNLVNGKVYLLSFKNVHRNQREELEVARLVARLVAPQPVPDVEEGGGKVLLGHGRKVDADAVTLSEDVRRRVEANLDRLVEARKVLAEERRGEGSGAALALCACDVNNIEPTQVLSAQICVSRAKAEMKEILAG